MLSNICQAGTPHLDSSVAEIGWGTISLGTLRLLLALAVASVHSPFGPIPGFRFLLAPTAVQGFFIISGFFITMVLNENASYRSPRTFYLSRYLRLYPMYIVC